MGYHAKLSPSSAHRWTSCTASIDAQEGIPNESSEDARQGTCCHQMGAEILEQDINDASGYLGRKMIFWKHDESDSNGEDWESEELQYVFDRDGLDHLGEVVVTQAMIDAVDSYVGFIRTLRDEGGFTLLVEQRVPIGHITGEDGATGQSDTVLI